MTKFAMETDDILSTEESSHIKITPRVLFTLNSFHKAKESTKFM